MHDKKLPGINIQAPWSRLLIEGKKSIETRTYQLPEKYRAKDLWLIETPGRLGKFKARVIGVIRFSEFRQYSSAAAFYEDSDLHLIHPDTKDYAWHGRTKFGWFVERVKVVDTFAAPTLRGIVYSRPFDRNARY